MTDYSQNGEQKYILKALGYGDWMGADLATARPPGRLLDIGAWNAKTFSNSRALIELGWSAVLFEPSPGPLKGLVEEYGNNPRVEVVGCPVTLHGGPVKLRVTEDALSAEADNAEHLKKWDGYGFYGTMTSYSVPFPFVFAAWGQFDFVSIDTEGTSVDLFRKLCYMKSRPRCVCLEHDSCWPEIEAAAKAGGYHLMHPPEENGINVVLERR